MLPDLHIGFSGGRSADESFRKEEFKELRAMLESRNEQALELWDSQVALVVKKKKSENESHPVVSDSLLPHGLSMEFSRPECWKGYR